jgi:hypothetical protein
MQFGLFYSAYIRMKIFGSTVITIKFLQHRFIDALLSGDLPLMLDKDLLYNVRIQFTAAH